MQLWSRNPRARSVVLPATGGAAAPRGVRDLHRSLPGYAPTPLVDLPELAVELGVGQVLVKDESVRLGLPAFKALGASWACRQVLDRSPGAELVTATDGNHGRAVARMAAQLGTKSTVFVPAVMPASTAALIAGEGARVVRVDGDYDEAVRTAAAHAAAPGRELVQDTAWEGYEEVPQWIVDGYATLLEEVDEALGRQPDLVVVPVGVGSLAQAVVAHYRAAPKAAPDAAAGADPDTAAAADPGAAAAVAPGAVIATGDTVGPARGTQVMSVEPDTAACVVTSLLAGEPRSVPTGDTVMAGLNCGTISSLAWPVLRDGLSAAITVTDEDALRASADLAALGVTSGPCGAATLAAIRSALGDPDRRRDLALDDQAVVVLLSTEGTSAA